MSAALKLENVQKTFKSQQNQNIIWGEKDTDQVGRKIRSKTSFSVDL